MTARDDDDREIERLIETRLLRVNALSFGIVAGLVAGLGLFVATNWLVLKGGGSHEVGPHLSLLAQYFLGYSTSAPKDGRWHSIEVRVRKGNYTIRSRRGFIAG